MPTLIKTFILLVLLSLINACSDMSKKVDTPKFYGEPAVSTINHKNLPHFYIIDVDSGKPAVSFVKNRLLWVKPVHMLPRYAGKTFIFNTLGKQFTAQTGHQFILDPSDMFTEQIQRWLSKTGLFSKVETDETATPDYVLEVAVSKLYGDVRPEHAPKSVLEMQFFLTKPDEPKKILFQIGLRVDAGIDKASPAKVTQGWSEGLKATLTKLEFGLNDYFHKQQGK